MSDLKSYLPKLVKMYDTGQLKAIIDMGEQSTMGPFRGVDSVYDAVEVCLAPPRITLYYKVYEYVLLKDREGSYRCNSCRYGLVRSR